MAPRANWKGFLRLSLVTCPVALYPATSESDKVSSNQLNKQTSHRDKYVKVDADTGEEVLNEDIVKGYALDKETFIEVSNEELDELALESTRTIDIDEFVEKSAIDPRYLIRPYYCVLTGRLATTPCGDPRDHPRYEQGRNRPRGAHQSRAHHRARADGQGPGRHAAPLSL